MLIYFKIALLHLLLHLLTITDNSYLLYLVTKWSFMLPLKPFWETRCMIIILKLRLNIISNAQKLLVLNYFICFMYVWRMYNKYFCTYIKIYYQLSDYKISLKNIHTRLISTKIPVLSDGFNYFWHENKNQTQI